MQQSVIIEALLALEQAATALAEIGTCDHHDGVLNDYREAGGTIGGIAENFIHARRQARNVIDEFEQHLHDSAKDFSWRERPY